MGKRISVYYLKVAMVQGAHGPLFYNLPDAMLWDSEAQRNLGRTPPVNKVKQHCAPLHAGWNIL
jgi:hypothetical protein